MDDGEILEAFCQKGIRLSKGRYDLRSPFVQGGARWATDGAVCVRMPAAAGEEDTPDWKLPKMAALPLRITRPEGSLPWPADDIYKSSGSCPLCEEKDLPECDCDGNPECGRCGGQGVVADPACPVCRGNLEGEYPLAQQISEGLFVYLPYHMRISKLPPPVTYSVQGKHNESRIILFWFDGGCGAVMELTPKHCVKADVGLPQL